MKNLFAVKCLMLGALLFSPLAHSAGCGSENIEFHNATPLEEKVSCESIEKIAAYFRSHGVELSNLKMKFFFESQVSIPGGFPGETIPVHGYFDTDDNSIHMTHFDSASQTQRRPWGLAWTEPMATSLLLHEIAHLYAMSYMGNNFRQVQRHWHELVAYAVQLELMPADLRAQVLGSETRPFDDRSSVSSMHYEMDPEQYARRAYLSVQAWGGGRFLKDLLELRVNEAKGQF